MFDQAIRKEDKISHLYIGVHTTHIRGEAIKKKTWRKYLKKKTLRPTAPKKRKKALRCQTTLWSLYFLQTTFQHLCIFLTFHVIYRSLSIHASIIFIKVVLHPSPDWPSGIKIETPQPKHQHPASPLYYQPSIHN